jgi:hypothetical protein
MLRKNMNASSHENPNSAGFTAEPITDNTAPTTIKTAGAFRQPDKSSGGGKSGFLLGKLMIFGVAQTSGLCF